MDAKKIYETAKESVVKIKAAVPSYSAEEGMEYCVIADTNGNVFSAMTNITVKDGSVARIPADVAAYLYMKNAGSMVASYIILISVADRRIIPPSDECFDLMFGSNPKNDDCFVVLSSSEQKRLSELRLIGDGTDYMTGFEYEDEEKKSDAEPEAEEDTEEEDVEDETELETAQAEEAEESEEEQDDSEETEEDEEEDEEEESDEDDEEEEEDDEDDEDEDEAPVSKKDNSGDFISGVQIDESNPFYAAPTNVKPPEDVVALFSEQPKDDLLTPADDDDAPPQPMLSKEELLKQAKKRKKVAKANFLFRKRK